MGTTNRNVLLAAMAAVQQVFQQSSGTLPELPKPEHKSSGYRRRARNASPDLAIDHHHRYRSKYRPHQGAQECERRRTRAW